MYLKKECVSCNKLYNYRKTDMKGSNGAWIKFYENGTRIVVFKHCYACYRDSFKTESKKNIINSKARDYNKTIKGLIVRTYRNMKSRVKGIQWRKSHLYKGLELLEKDDFYEWSLSNDSYQSLYKEWVKSNYSKKLTPSIDRIDPSKGYVIDNMRWITHSENSRLGNFSRRNSKK